MTYKYHQPHNDVWLEIEQELIQQCYLEVYEYFPKEFGGIFLGEVNDNYAKITKIITPGKFENSKSYFKRYSKELNSHIANIHSDSDGNIIYLGEWHSHPLNSPIPSQKDLDAMIEISLSSRVSIQTPILLIISYTETGVFTPRFYLTYNKKLFPYEED